MLVRTDADFRSLIEDVTTSGHLAIDTETTGLHPYEDDRLTGISVAGAHHSGERWSYYLPVGHAPSEVKNWDPVPLIALIDQSARWGRLHRYHHATFDWAFLARAYPGEFRLPENLHDTQVCSWLIDENQRHGLKESAARYFGEDAKEEQRVMKARFAANKKAWKDEHGDTVGYNEWAEGTAEDIGDYAEQDAVLTDSLADFQIEADLDWSGQALNREMDVQRSLYRMIRTGIRVDAEAIARQEHAARLELDAITAEFEGVNLDSPKQLGKLLYEDFDLASIQTTPSGAPSTSRAALEELEGQHPAIERILAYRRLRKALSGYYGPLQERIGHDGRIHPHFSSTRTVTGRLACSAPNLMTIPRGDTLLGVRDLFVPADGYELWEYDLNSAELRVMAGFANETNMMSAIEEGRDLHGETADSIWGFDWTGLQRRLAKNLNYGFAYGLQGEGFADYMVKGTGKRVTPMIVAQAEQILDGYRRTYPRLVRLMEHLKQAARRDGKLPLHVPGRYRHFRSPGVIVKPHTALNALVQGGVAEFMKDVMVQAEGELERMGARLCLQVHDSLVIEVPPGSGRFIAELLQDVADGLSPFRMRMLFDAQAWGDHD